MKFKTLSTKEYVELCIKNYENKEEENKRLQESVKEESEKSRYMNESIIEMQNEYAKGVNAYQQFSEAVKSMFLAECIFKVYNEATAINNNKDSVCAIERGLINNFIAKNGVNNLISRFKTTSYMLSEFAALTEKYHKKVIESAEKGNPETYKLDDEIKNSFFDELNMHDVSDVSNTIRTRVAASIEDFMTENINNKTEIEETIKAAQEKIEAIKGDKNEEELKESYQLLAKRNISAIRHNSIKNVFSEMVRLMSKHALTESSFRANYTSNNKLNMDKIVERCEILYTFLETVNTAKMIKVDEEYIKSVLKDME